MSVWRKPSPLFSTNFELLRSQQDCGERKIFIDSGDSEDKEGCQRRHSAVQTLHGIVMAEASQPWGNKEPNMEMPFQRDSHIVHIYV